MQNSINELTLWTELNHMALNSQKTKCMLVTTYQMRSIINPLPNIYVNNTKIDEVQSHKILGVTIENNLNWDVYIGDLVERLNYREKQLSRIKHFIDLNTRKIFFHAFIGSSIDYASTLWDKSSDNKLRPLNVIYKRIIKQILLKSNSLKKDDYLTLGILPLTEKLKFNKGVFMHKIMTKNAPNNLINMFQKNPNKNFHNDVVTRTPNTELYKKSFHYSGCTLWNNLPEQMRQIKHLYSFKTAYKKYIFSQVKL